jgi:hypothetical protein
MNRMDEMLTRQFKFDSAIDDAIAARVLVSIGAKPLPTQHHSIFRSWPNALLTLDFAPAWPRIAALACVALLGCMIGLFGPGAQLFDSAGGAAAMQIADADATLAFEPEPLTGVRP